VNARHVGLIARYGARYSVRGGVGLVFLLLSLTFGLMVAHLTLQSVEQITKVVGEHARNHDPQAVQKEVLDGLVDRARPVIAWVLTKKQNDPAAEQRAKAAAETWADYLLRDRPAMLSAILLVLMFGWPLIVSFGAFDLFAGDIASRQLRYQLLRADRASIFFGRLVGSLYVFGFVLVLLGATVAGYMAIKLPSYGAGALFGWAAYGVVALAVATLPYVALCAWMSSAIGSSFAALTIVSLIIGGVPLVAMFGRLTHEAADYVNYLLPWGFQMRLFHPEPLQVALAALGCALQTLLFGWLGYRNFTRRDL
jgi:ABC-type transport system involved in multi-copper enzyme maturation permease subunit